MRFCCVLSLAALHHGSPGGATKGTPEWCSENRAILQRKKTTLCEEALDIQGKAPQPSLPNMNYPYLDH